MSIESIAVLSMSLVTGALDTLVEEGALTEHGAVETELALDTLVEEGALIEHGAVEAEDGARQSFDAERD